MQTKKETEALRRARELTPTSIERTRLPQIQLALGNSVQRSERSHALDEQVRAFKRIQLHRHGVPRTITADGGCGKGAFSAMYKELQIDLIITAGHSHQRNGRIERAN